MPITLESPLLEVENPKFEHGHVVMTRNVAIMVKEVGKEFHDFVIASFKRHMQGDWGDMCDQDCENNVLGLLHNHRLHSAYECPDNISLKIWIVTEGDRSVTTILFPRDY